MKKQKKTDQKSDFDFEAFRADTIACPLANADFLAPTDRLAGISENGVGYTDSPRAVKFYRVKKKVKKWMDFRFPTFE